MAEKVKPVLAPPTPRRIAATGVNRTNLKEDSKSEPELVTTKPDTSSSTGARQTNNGAGANAERRSMFATLSGAQGQIEPELNAGYGMGMRKKVADFVNHPLYNTLTLLFNLHVVFFLVIIRASTGSSDFDGATGVTTLALVVFLAEIAARSYAEPRYCERVHVWLVDVVVVLSIIPDVPWLWPQSAAIDGLGLVRAMRLERTAARAVRGLPQLLARMGIEQGPLPCRQCCGPRAQADVEEGKEDPAESKLHGDFHCGAEPEISTPSCWRRWLAGCQAVWSPLCSVPGSGLVEQFRVAVELRLWVFGLLVFLFVANLNYAELSNREDWRVGLGVVGDMVQTTNSATAQTVAEAFAARTEELVYLVIEGATVITDSRGSVTNNKNLLTESVAGVYKAEFDLTEQAKDRAVWVLVATLLVWALLLWTSRAIAHDADGLIVAPLRVLTSKLEQLASKVFSFEVDCLSTTDNALFDAMMTKLSSMFDTSHFKVTTLYSPPGKTQVVWTVTVCKRKDAPKEGVGVSVNRIDFKSLASLQHAGAKREQIRNFMWRNFIEDPLAYKHFEQFLKNTSPKDYIKLRVFYQVGVYKRLMHTAVKLGEYLSSHFLDPDAARLSLSVEQWEDVQERVFFQEPNAETFQSVEDMVDRDLRSNAFANFTNDRAAFDKLKVATKATANAILCQHSYPPGKHPTKRFYTMHRDAVRMAELNGTAPPASPRSRRSDIGSVESSKTNSRAGSFRLYDNRSSIDSRDLLNQVPELLPRMSSFSYRNHVMQLMGGDPLERRESRDSGSIGDQSMESLRRVGKMNETIELSGEPSPRAEASERPSSTFSEKDLEIALSNLEPNPPAAKQLAHVDTGTEPQRKTSSMELGGNLILDRLSENPSRWNSQTPSPVASRRGSWSDPPTCAPHTKHEEQQGQREHAL